MKWAKWVVAPDPWRPYVDSYVPDYQFPIPRFTLSSGLSCKSFPSMMTSEPPGRTKANSDAAFGTMDNLEPDRIDRVFFVS